MTQLRSLDIFFSYATHLTFAQNFEAAFFEQNFEAFFLPTFCRQLRSLDIFDWNLWLQLLYAQIFCLSLPNYCRQLRIIDVFDRNLWLQLLFAQIFYLSLPTYCRQLKILIVFARNLWLQLLFAQFFCLFCLPFVGNICLVLLCDQNSFGRSKMVLVWPNWFGHDHNDLVTTKMK